MANPVKHFCVLFLRGFGYKAHMKFKNGGGISEILHTGQTPTCYNFRNPQAWSHWRSGKAASRTHQNRGIANSGILTRQSKDNEERARTLPSSVKKTFRF